MKLRNKKTGEVVNAIVYSPIGNYNIRLWEDKDYLDVTCNDEYLGDYKTLADLNEEWEDYTPAEPLIEDEKIRKAVRAWADLNNIKEVAYIITGGRLSVFTKNSVEIDFAFQVQGVQDDKHYTITELCGEEDE